VKPKLTAETPSPANLPMGGSGPGFLGKGNHALCEMVAFLLPRFVEDPIVVEVAGLDRVWISS
jgi:hypothetical protein